MCGRYRLSRHKQLLAEYFDTDFDSLDWQPHYNIAPTQPVPVLTQPSKSSLLKASLMRWGLVPSWAPDRSSAARMINARAETVASKPAFRESLQKRRCLIPADAFYEWRRTAGSKQPFCFEVGQAEIFAFAGLWDTWRTPDGQTVETFAILTTTANELLSGVHHRMPVILSPGHYKLWLDPTMQDAEGAAALLAPFASQRMKSFPVSNRVNHVANDDSQCSTPAELPPATLSLFD